MVDLDQSGTTFQRTKVYLGPSLGWVLMQVKPSRNITAGGTTTLTSGDSIVFANVAALVTIQLPDVRLWLNEFAYRPATGFERAIWIKDLGGNAQAFNITVLPFGAQVIDGLASYTIINNRALIRLYPLSNVTGWFVG